MPVKKYRSVTEMPGDRPLPPLRAENLRIACELSELAQRLGGTSTAPGVRKFRSVEEASEARRAREKREILERRSRRGAVDRQ